MNGKLLYFLEYLNFSVDRSDTLANEEVRKNMETANFRKI